MKIIVKNMTCNHCKEVIQKSLLINGVVANVNLEEKSVTLAKETDYDKAVEAINKAGYEIEQ